MLIYTNTRQEAGAIACRALGYVYDVSVQNRGGSLALFVVSFDERIVMNDEELAAVAGPDGFTAVDDVPPIATGD